MPDLPVQILKVCYFVVLGVFAIVAFLRRKGRQVLVPDEPFIVMEEATVSL